MPIFAITHILAFPPVYMAEEDGLLGVGGDLSAERLILAYQSGIFPWYNEEDPILWWSPDPRFVLFPQELKVSKSMKSVLKRGDFRITVNQAFRQVMENCRTTPREGQEGSWIQTEVIEAYEELHRRGIAHSVEAWLEDKLVGGLYGVKMGKTFCGESMFAHVSNASKAAFITYVQDYLLPEGCTLIDCQVETPHLASLGAKSIPRKQFLKLLRAGMWNENDVDK